MKQGKSSSASGENSPPCSFPRDTPIVPELSLSTGDYPQRLEEYFDVVSRLLEKSFRDEASVHLGLRSVKVATIVRPSSGRHTFAAAEKAESATSLSSSSSSSSSAAQTRDEDDETIPNYFIFSPRAILFNDGRPPFAKVKIGCRLQLPDALESYTRLLIDTHGCITAKCDLDNIRGSGIGLRGAFLLNTIDSAAGDQISLSGHVERDAFTLSVLGRREADGVTSVRGAADVRLYNMHLGCGVERFVEDTQSFLLDEDTEVAAALRQHNNTNTTGAGSNANNAPQHPSFYHHHDGRGSTARSTTRSTTDSYAEHMMYVGAGCFGRDWHMAGKVFRDDDSWSMASIALYHNIRRIASVAIYYHLDAREGIANTTLGVSRRFTAWGKKVVGALKINTTGTISILTEMNLDRYTRCGLVTRLRPGSGTGLQFGLVASIQSE